MDKIICKICGFNGWSIVSHLRGKHGMSVDQYRVKFQDAEVISQRSKQLTSKSCMGKGRPKGTPATESQKLILQKIHTGEGNPFFNHKHSADTKKKMSDNHADFSGSNNPLRKAILNDPSITAKLSQQAKLRWASYSPEKREAIAEKYSKAIAESPKMQNARYHKYHVCGHFDSNKGGRVFFRSSWEKMVLDYLEKSNDVISFSLDKLCIPYYTNGKLRHTRVDFVVVLSNNVKIILDVKPLSMLGYHNNQDKIAATEAYCKNNGMLYFLVTRKDESMVHNFIIGAMGK